ncbi:hypothetical protein CDAR_432971 [Caerostris darwini]|uniref:Uncharacterized protein n=1 Tax=Caerostris darwini TaxID=1538125 RepID=A0AAV4QM89_9ARAC|nr:hypothetical protein CDAR_432971 [Caerostris darwini]
MAALARLHVTVAFKVPVIFSKGHDPLMCSGAPMVWDQSSSTAEWTGKSITLSLAARRKEVFGKNGHQVAKDPVLNEKAYAFRT